MLVNEKNKLATCCKKLLQKNTPRNICLLKDDNKNTWKRYEI